MKTLRQHIPLRTLSWRLAALLAGCAAGHAQNAAPKVDEMAGPNIEKDAANWKLFSSKEGRFSIIFPGLAKEETQTVDTPNGAFTIRVARLQTSAEYSVMYADYPPAINDGDVELANKVLDSGLEGAVAEVNAKLMEVKPISLENHPGRLYKERMRLGHILRGKTFLVGHRLYQIAITTPKEEEMSAENARLYQLIAQKFLDSFRLLAP